MKSIKILPTSKETIVNTNGLKQGTKMWMTESLVALKKNEKRRYSYFLTFPDWERNLLMITRILNECIESRDIQVWTIKDNYRLEIDISSKVLALPSVCLRRIRKKPNFSNELKKRSNRNGQRDYLWEDQGSKSSKLNTGHERKFRNCPVKKYHILQLGRILGVHGLTVK